MSLTSLIIRRAFKRGDDKRDAGLTTPADIRRYDDIAYGPDPAQVLDVYRPAAAEGQSLPVIVSVHGGGWVYGDKERYQYYCMSLAQRGFAVVNFTYRLAPKHKFPAALEDTCLVFHWLMDHAASYGFDAGHVFAVGDSAGAHLLGLFCCMCVNPAYAAEFDFAPPEDFKPNAVALNCGVYTIRKSGLGDLNTRLMTDLMPKRGTVEEINRISVLAHVTAAFPPAIVMTCSDDFLKDQAPPLLAKFESLGVPATYLYYGTEEHPLAHVFHCDIKTEDARRCNDDECAFFRERC